MVMEQTIEQLQQRLIDLERRFFPIEKVVYETSKYKIEEYKQQEIDNNGTTYNVSATIETDKGTNTINFKVKAWSEKQALYYANENVIFPNMSKLKESGKIKWFKTISNQIVK
jgi:hypothetical protein